MERAVPRQATVQRVDHEFFCDDCGVQLGVSPEYDDGYYREFGEFEVKCYVYGKWHKLKKCLCDRCKVAEIAKIRKMLDDAGFEVE